jgi:phage-related protein
MGTSIEMIQNAYQGFAKQNYTMLDNLKLGYGGTASEMARLINDSGVLGKKIKVTAKTVNSVSFDKIIEAIGVMQDRMGITGTTAKEAGATIAGSVGAMKSAWTNLVTGFANGNADIKGLINNLVTTIVGDGTPENLGVIGNVLPAVQTALSGIGSLIENAIPILIERLPGLLQQIIPTLLSSAAALTNSVVAVLPELVDLIVDTLIDNAPMLIVAATELILALAAGLIGAIPKLIKSIPTIIRETVAAFKSSENIKKFLDTGKEFVLKIGEGLNNIISSAKTWGRDLIDNFINGIMEKWDALKKKVSDLAQTVKDYIGFSEPKKGPLSNFHTYAPDMMDLFAKGIRDNENVITDQIEKSFDFGERTMKFGAEYSDGYGIASQRVSGMAYSGSTFGDIHIHVNGGNYDENALAEALAVQLQGLADGRAAVYA